MPEPRPNGLAAALERAQRIADRFTKATEAINERLREVQSALVGLRLGTRGVVELLLPGDEPDWRRYLVFGKVNGDWLLFIESGADDSRDDWTITPLLNASRELRLAAVDLLPLLVEDMVDSAESGVAESEAKAKSLDVFLATMQPPEAKPIDGLSASIVSTLNYEIPGPPATPRKPGARIPAGLTRQVPPGTQGKKL